METQTRLSRHNKFISAENITILSVSSEDSTIFLIEILVKRIDALPQIMPGATEYLTETVLTVSCLWSIWLRREAVGRLFFIFIS